MIELKNVCKIYSSAKSEFTALNKINLTIEDGDVFGIIGLSGAGKSTLVRCMNLLEKPTSGSVIIDGEDLTKADKKRLRVIRRKVSMIFQQFNENRIVITYNNIPLIIHITTPAFSLFISPPAYCKSQ